MKIKKIWSDFKDLLKKYWKQQWFKLTVYITSSLIVVGLILATVFLVGPFAGNNDPENTNNGNAPPRRTAPWEGKTHPEVEEPVDLLGNGTMGLAQLFVLNEEEMELPLDFPPQYMASIPTYESFIRITWEDLIFEQRINTHVSRNSAIFCVQLQNSTRRAVIFVVEMVGIDVGPVRPYAVALSEEGHRLEFLQLPAMQRNFTEFNNVGYDILFERFGSDQIELLVPQTEFSETITLQNEFVSRNFSTVIEPIHDIELFTDSRGEFVRIRQFIRISGSDGSGNSAREDFILESLFSWDFEEEFELVHEGQRIITPEE